MSRGDKKTGKNWRDHCGVVGVYNHPEAANLVYLGLFALQHRGQESAGILSSNKGKMYIEKAMGKVADVFNRTRLAQKGFQAALFTYSGLATSFSAVLVELLPIPS